MRTFLAVALLCSLATACANRSTPAGEVADDVSFGPRAADGIVLMFVSVEANTGVLGIESVDANGLSATFVNDADKVVWEWNERGSFLDRFWDSSLGSGSYPQIGRVPAGKLSLNSMYSATDRRYFGIYDYPERDFIDLEFTVEPGTVNYVGHVLIDLHANRPAVLIDVEKREFSETVTPGMAVVGISRDDEAARAFLEENYPGISAPFTYSGPEPRTRYRVRKE